MTDARDLKCKTCDHFRNGCTAPVPFWAEPHGRPRIYSEDSGCDVHTGRAALSPSPEVVKELVEALRPLAALPIGNATSDDIPLYGLDGFYITHGDIRRARAALANLEGGE